MRLAGIFLLVCAMPVAAQAPVISEGGVGDAATGSKTVVPGSLISIFGSNLAASTATADSIPLSTSLASVSVTFNNVPAPLHFVAPSQINAQLPWNTLPSGTLSGTANVVVTRSGVASAPQTVTVGEFSPGIYRFGTTNMAVVYNATDAAVAQPANCNLGVTCRPAKVGEFMTILGSGLGVVMPTIANGAASTDGQLRTSVQPIVTVGGMTVPVLFAGLAPFAAVGVYQVNVQLSQNVGTGNALPLQWQAGGITSSADRTIAIN